MERARESQRELEERTHILQTSTTKANTEACSWWWRLGGRSGGAVVWGFVLVRRGDVRCPDAETALVERKGGEGEREERGEREEGEGGGRGKRGGHLKSTGKGFRDSFCDLAAEGAP